MVTYLAGNRIRGTNAERIIKTGTKSIDGSYTVLKFTEDGTFTPTSSFNVEYLVVGGGGGGGGYDSSSSYGGGGGGAGGYRTATGHAVTAQSYSITIGSGGNGAYLARGVNGTDSVFDTITSSGGGGGGQGSGSNMTGLAGASGGGGGKHGHCGGGLPVADSTKSALIKRPSSHSACQPP